MIEKSFILKLFFCFCCKKTEVCFMRKIFVIFIFPLLHLFACNRPSSDLPQDDTSAIQAIMDNQVSCWNKGDLDCFMSGYWHSDSLMFIGKNGITYGYEKTLARYQQTYPDRAAMGHLSFEIISVNPLSDQTCFMVGKWMLKRESDDLNGCFTLLFKKINGQWYIITDHSS